MSHTTTGSIFDDLGLDAGEALCLKIKSELMNDLLRFIETNNLTQQAAATVLKVSQPRISNLNNGRISLFSIEMLIKMAERAGIDVAASLRKGVDVPQMPIKTKKLRPRSLDPMHNVAI